MARIIDIRYKKNVLRPFLLLVTSHRMDCFMLCLKSLALYTDFSRLGGIYILADGVSDEHAMLIRSFQNKHKNIIDVHVSPCKKSTSRSRILSIENSIMERHKDAGIIRISEDVFVTPGWLDSLLAAYTVHNSQPHAGVFSGFIPISRTGKQVLDRIMRAHYPDERRSLPPVAVAENAPYHRFVWEKILFDGLMDKYRMLDRPNYMYLNQVSSDLLLLDRRILDSLLPMPLDPPRHLTRPDEYYINTTLREKGMRAVIITDCVAHHFSHASCELFLRNNISIDDIWWYITLLNDHTSPAPDNKKPPHLSQQAKDKALNKGLLRLVK